MIYPEVAQRIEKIKNDRGSGATRLSLDAVDILGYAAEKSGKMNTAEFLEEMEAVGKRLIEARPSMAPLRNRVLNILRDIREEQRKGRSLDDLRELTVSLAAAMKEDSRRITLRIIQHASTLIRKKTVLTHSYSSTVLETLKQAENVRAIATESRPLYEGRLTAKKLAEDGIPVTLITDASVGHFMVEVDTVLVGVDTVLSDGSLINKMGTYLVALAARESDVPFYGVCETYKFVNRNAAELEEMEASEVVAEPLPDVKVRNIYFDVTPAKFVTAIITEKGLLRPSEIAQHTKSGN